jgi:hypothetical protein
MTDGKNLNDREGGLHRHVVLTVTSKMSLLKFRCSDYSALDVDFSFGLQLLLLTFYIK